MTDTSDGETKNRQFANLTTLSRPELATKISKSSEFKLMCYDVSTGKDLDTCSADFKKCVNNGKFKKYLGIPAKTKIEVNLNVNQSQEKETRRVSFSFKYRENSFALNIILSDELLKSCSEQHAKVAQWINANKEKNNSTNNENPSQLNSKFEELTLSQKIDALTQQINSLTEMLKQEQEKNRQLTEQLIAMQKERTERKAAKAAKRKKATNSTTAGKKQNIEMNEFEEYDEDVSLHSVGTSDDDFLPPRAPLTNNNNNNYANVNRTFNAHTDVNTHKTTLTTKPAKRERNIPPIVVFDDNQKRMSERIVDRKICNIAEFHFVRVNKSKYRIQVSTLEQYDSVLTLLNELSIKYHTYTPNERKPIHVLMKRIPKCYDEDDILEHLRNDYGLIPIKLTKFITKKMQESGIESTIWHASFDPKTDKKIIFGIKHIGNVYEIIIEQMKNKSISQCRRCWRYEHTESNCSYDVRCPQCLNIHQINSCRLNDNPSLKPACVNCNKDGHAANSKECPVYQRILERRNSPGNKKPTKTNPMPNNTNANNHTKPNVSFASAVRGNQRQNKTNTQPNTNSEIMDILKHLATQQVQMNALIMKIVPQLASGSKR